LLRTGEGKNVDRTAAQRPIGACGTCLSSVRKGGDLLTGGEGRSYRQKKRAQPNDVFRLKNYSRVEKEGKSPKKGEGKATASSTSELL